MCPTRCKHLVGTGTSRGYINLSIQGAERPQEMSAYTKYLRPSINSLCYGTTATLLLQRSDFPFRVTPPNKDDERAATVRYT
jgi:hypothetical protein